jgi:hypothetical protein
MISKNSDGRVLGAGPCFFAAAAVVARMQACKVRTRGLSGTEMQYVNVMLDWQQFSREFLLLFVSSRRKEGQVGFETVFGAIGAVGYRKRML